MKSQEQWLKVEGYSSYFVSNQGRVKRRYVMPVSHDGSIIEPMEEIIKTKTDNWGHKVVTLRGKDTQTTHRVCALACTAFAGTKSAPSSLVGHRNGDKNNNYAENLFWTVKNKNYWEVPAMTEQDAKHIRFFLLPELDACVIASLYGCPASVISNILANAVWPDPDYHPSGATKYHHSNAGDAHAHREATRLLRWRAEAERSNKAARLFNRWS